MRLLPGVVAGVFLCFASMAMAQESKLALATGATQPHLSIDHDGNIHVVFIHNGNIAVSSSVDQGKSFSEPIVAIDAKGRAQGGMQRGPRIGVDARKQLTVTCPV